MLGPLLFSLFINDLPLHVSSDMFNCEMFANETTLGAANAVPVSLKKKKKTSKGYKRGI